MDTWRSTCKRVIAKVIEENPEADYKTFKKLLRDAYPFGERARFPYKVWCDQQKRTLQTLYPNKDGKPCPQPIEGLFAPGSLVEIQERCQSNINELNQIFYPADDSIKPMAE